MLKVCEYSLINVPKRIFNLVISQRKLAEEKKATSKASELLKSLGDW